MSIIAWLVLGTLAGFIASRYIGRSTWSGLENYTIGILSSVLAGVVSCHVFGGDSMIGLDPTSLLMAASGATVGLLIYNIALLRRAV